MAPRGRFELPTFRLTAERSTIELPGNVVTLLHLTDGFNLRFSIPGIFLLAAKQAMEAAEREARLRPSPVCPGQLFDSSKF